MNHKSSLSELTQEEWQDFQQLTKKLEAANKKTFGATHFNWTCLMNEAYRTKVQASHVHWHIFPRYENTLSLNNIDFEDTEFGYHYVHRKNKVNRQTLEAIAARLRAILQLPWIEKF